LIEALGVSATQRETTQTNVFIPAPFLLVNTVRLNQSTPNSFYPKYQSALSRTLLRFCGTTFVETAVYAFLGRKKKKKTFKAIYVRSDLFLNINRSCILQVVHLSVSPSCVTRKKIVMKKKTRGILGARGRFFLAVFFRVTRRLSKRRTPCSLSLLWLVVMILPKALDGAARKRGLI